MTNEFAIKVLTELRGYGDKFANIGFDRKQALDMAIKALEQEPSEECISRKAVEKITWGWESFKTKLNQEGLNVLKEVREKVADLPPVIPQPKTGHWIEVEVHNSHATLKCSECGRVIEPTYTFGEYSYEDIKEFYPYCHCGADMRESEAEEHETLHG